MADKSAMKGALRGGVKLHRALNWRGPKFDKTITPKSVYLIFINK